MNCKTPNNNSPSNRAIFSFRKRPQFFLKARLHPHPPSTMASSTQFIYVLLLEQGKYYVGSSNNVQRRFQEHQSGQGSAWTRLYPPIYIEKQYVVAPGSYAGLAEDHEVTSMMMQHGIDRVRGGSYSTIQFTAEQQEALKRSLRHAGQKCLKCGRTGHIAVQCYARTEVALDTGNTMTTTTTKKLNAGRGPQVRLASTSRQQQGQHETRRAVACERCGRNTHTADRCYATSDVHGCLLVQQLQAVVSVTNTRTQKTGKRCRSTCCERCGRDTHTADRCYATKDIHGNLLIDDDSEDEESEEEHNCRCCRGYHRRKRSNRCCY